MFIANPSRFVCIISLTVTGLYTLYIRFCPRARKERGRARRTAAIDGRYRPNRPITQLSGVRLPASALEELAKVFWWMNLNSLPVTLGALFKQTPSRHNLVFKQAVDLIMFNARAASDGPSVAWIPFKH